MTVIARPRILDNREDGHLVERVIARDASALAALYDRYGSTCYALARRITADDGLAAEVVQDTFLALWRRPEGYQEQRGRFATWLLTITHHRAVDAVRREHPHQSRRLGVELLDHAADQKPAVIDIAVAHDRAARAKNALASLTDGQREALVLAYYGGYTQREIARLLSIPLGTVKTRTAAALSRLRELLASDEDTP